MVVCPPFPCLRGSGAFQWREKIEASLPRAQGFLDWKHWENPDY